MCIVSSVEKAESKNPRVANTNKEIRIFFSKFRVYNTIKSSIIK